MKKNLSSSNITHNNPMLLPVVGMVCTLCVGSDSYAGIITKVSASGKTFDFETGSGEARTARWSDKRSAFRVGSCTVTPGVSRNYSDPSF